MEETREGAVILAKIVKGEALSAEESAALATQVSDLAKGIPLLALLALPGGGVATVALVKLAKKFGATHTVNVSREKSTKAVYGITEGRGADYVFVTVGDKNAIEQGFKILGRGGTLVVVGMTANGVKVEFDSCKFASIEQSMLGSKMGSTRLVTDIPWYISLYQQGRIKIDELITGRYPIEEINEAIADVSRSDTLRNVIVF